MINKMAQYLFDRILIKRKHEGILKYTDYKKHSFVLLQTVIEKDTRLEVNPEQICLRYYRNYLCMCDIKDKHIFEKINEYDRKINSWHFVEKKRGMNYDKYVATNINQLMDALLK